MTRYYKTVNKIFFDFLFRLGNAFNLADYTGSSYSGFKEIKYQDDLLALQSDWDAVGKAFDDILIQTDELRASKK